MIKNQSRDDKIIALLEENLKVSQEILRLSNKAQKWIHWQRAKSIIYFLLFAIPIILAFIYLPPVLSDLAVEYQKIVDVILPQQKNIINAFNGQ